MLEIFQIPFMQKALVISLVSSCFFAYVSVYIVLRRIVFVGIALSQVAACGLALGYLIHMNPLLVSIVLTIIGTILFAVQKSEKAVTRESSIGFVYAAAMALSVLFVAKSAQAESHIFNLLSGNILTVTSKEVYTGIFIFLLCLFIFVIFKRQLMALSFDEEFARASGLKTKFWNFTFYIVIGFALSIGMKTAGILLIFSYLLLPGFCALIVVKKINDAFTFAVVFGMITTIVGLIASFKYDLPSGPAIVAVQVLLFILFWSGSKLRI
jgi:zinc transport system permease protein